MNKTDQIKLVTFGDSWPAGAELGPNEVPYGNLLAEMLNANFSNYAQQGTSNEHMILQLKNNIVQLTENNTVAIFFITSPTRACYIDTDGKVHNIYPQSDKSQGDQAYYYFKYLHSTAHEEFKMHTTMLSLQRMCSESNIQDFYIVGWSRCNFDYPGIDKSKIFKQGTVTCADLFGVNGENELSLASENQYVYPNRYHPNQQGHMLIAQTLFEWIKDKIV